ncbi:hypothetical protein FVE85_0227 [Porphyridium purpureum]|uniref:N-acetyltransferase domain-containing protein n=1 Tax=Porphyridium purpureum TaxID=35688 RepID=A0A5J4YZJ3_PORPP|nr:hypothetical protein FVE85_0227 [Porphyridium purpureum]|eukprot:POR8846..scf208_2
MITNGTPACAAQPHGAVPQPACSVPICAFTLGQLFGARKPSLKNKRYALVCKASGGGGEDGHASPRLVLRQGRKQDLAFIRKSLFAESMNPTIAGVERFVVAETAEEGLSDEEGSRKVVGFGQVRPVSDSAQELASVFVEREYRRRGIASAVIQELVTLHAEDERGIYLMTLSRTVGLYEALGFRSIPASELPLSMRVEFLLGRVVARIAAGGESLAAMRLLTPQK